MTIHSLLNQGGGSQNAGSLLTMLAVLNAIQNRGGGGGGGGRRRRRRRQSSGGHDEEEEFDYDDETFDEYDAVVGAADEADMAAILDMDEGDFDESDVEGVGAKLATLQNKLARLQNKLESKKIEYNALPVRRKMRRKKLANDIGRLQKRITNLESKVSSKKGKFEAKYTKKYGTAPPPGTMLDRGGSSLPGVVPPGTGSPGGPVFRPGAPAVLGSFPWHMAERPPGSGMRIAFRDDVTGSKYTRITVGVGAGLRTAPIAMTTRGVAFGRYRVRGIEYKLQAVKPFTSGGSIEQEMMINIDFRQVQVAGNIDLLLQDLDGTQAAQSTNGAVTVARTLTGVRQDSVLDKTNVGTLAAIFRQEITTTGTNVEAVFTAALVVDAITDSAAQRGSG